MKKLLLSTVFCVIASSMFALSYSEARDRSWYLTDKMAYDLNLSQEQYDKVYEINLNYFLNINYSTDIGGVYWNYRDMDLRYVLTPSQYDLYRYTNYFYRPLVMRNGICIMLAYDYYDRGFFYFSRPTIYDVYRGRPLPPRHYVSPYRNMTFSSYGGMRDRYSHYSHGFYYNNGIRYDAPRPRTPEYGRRNFRDDPVYRHRDDMRRPDMDRGNFNRGRADDQDRGRTDNRDFSANRPQNARNRNNDFQSQIRQQRESSNGKTYSSGGNYRDKIEGNDRSVSTTQQRQPVSTQRQPVIPQRTERANVTPRTNTDAARTDRPSRQNTNIIGSGSKTRENPVTRTVTRSNDTGNSGKAPAPAMRKRSFGQ